MNILVDTNVISDVIHDDPDWRRWAETQMSAHVGSMMINPYIYAELCCWAQSTTELDDSINLLGIGYEEISKAALYLAAQAFLIYRRRGGAKTSPLPDFFHRRTRRNSWIQDPDERHRTLRNLFPNGVTHLPVKKHA